MSRGQWGIPHPFGEALATFCRDFIVLALASSPLLWVAIVNGFPLVFSDTGGYLRIGTELYFPLDRPATYGLAIAPLHWLGGPWAVVAAQALFTSFLIRQTLSVALASTVSPLQLFAVTSVLSITSLPWFAGQIMPDLFTGLLPLAMFVLVWGAKSMKPRKRILWAGIVAGLIGFHLTHLVIAAGTWFILVLVGAALGFLRQNFAGSVFALASIVVAVLGMSSLNLVGAGSFRPSLMSGTFMFARLLDGGVAQPVLVEACARERLLICVTAPLATRPGVDLPGQAYLWDSASPRHGLREVDAKRFADEESLIVRRSLASRPGEVVNLALSGWGRQLLTAKSGDGMDPYGNEMQISRQIRLHFARSAPAWTASRQQHGELRSFAYPPALAVAAMALAAIIILLPQLRKPTIIALSAGLIGTVLINAAVCGILSGVFDRYQSRVIWLLTFAAVVAALAWTQSGRPPEATAPNA